MSHWTPEEQALIIAELCLRSSVDLEFRELALRDPAQAIAKVTTKAMPPGCSFQFVDNSGSLKTVVLPDPITETEDLSDIELERVSGGDFTSVAGYTP